MASTGSWQWTSVGDLREKIITGSAGNDIFKLEKKEVTKEITLQADPATGIITGSITIVNESWSEVE